MAAYIGFSSINANKPKTTNPTRFAGLGDGGTGSILQGLVWGKKFTLTDEILVVQDFINAFNIRKGEKVGQPQYGTTLWDFLFEPNTADIQIQIEQEVRRVASLDPRMNLNSVALFTNDNGILIEVEVAVVPYNNAATLSLFFNRATNIATVV